MHNLKKLLHHIAVALVFYAAISLLAYHERYVRLGQFEEASSSSSGVSMLPLHITKGKVHGI